MRSFPVHRRLVATLADRRAATSIEYGLLVAVVAIGLIVLVRSIGDSIVSIMIRLTGTLDGIL